MLELDKPVAERDWNAVIGRLQAVARTSARLGMDVLWAAAVRTQMEVLHECAPDPQAHDLLVRDALDKTVADSKARFLILECVGRHMFSRGQELEAARVLDEALEKPWGELIEVRTQALLCAAAAWGIAAPHRSIELARDAVALIRTNSLEKLALARALVELALAQWTAGQHIDAFGSLAEASEHLLNVPQAHGEDQQWRGMLSLVVHAAGFMARAMQGCPPTHTSDGGEYVPPRPGFLYRASERAHLAYRPEKPAALAALLVLYAHLVGNDAAAAAWAQRALDLAHQAGTADALGVVMVFAVPYLLERDLVEVVLDGASRVGKSSEDLSNVPRGGLSEERSAMLFGLLPMAFRLALVAITDRDAAAALASRVAEKLREIGASKPTSTYWTKIAHFFRLCFIEAENPREIVSAAKRFDDGPERIIGNIAVSVHRDQPLKSALMAHLATVATVLNCYNKDPLVRDRLIIPFYEAYWRAAFERERFSFITPRQVERALADAMNLHGVQRLNAILAAVRDGLGAPPGL